MIVAYNALSLRPGVSDGAATYSLNVLTHLPAALPEAEIVVVARDAESRLDAIEGIRVVRPAAARGTAGRLLVELVSLGRIVSREGADVLLSPNESIPLGLRCPVVVVAQNLVYHRADPDVFLGASPWQRVVSQAQFAYYRRRMAVAYRRAAAVIAVSAETGRVLAERAGLDPGKTAVVYEGSDSVLLPPSRPGGRVPRLLAVSTLAPYKNAERAIDVLDVLRRSRPELTLEFVGGDWRGYREVVRAYAERAGLSPAVHFSDSAGADALAERYGTSLALLHLSECESFGLPVVEAMRSGLPVVVSDRSSLPEVAAGAALLVDPDRPAEAAAEIERLLADPGRLDEFVVRGRARAAELTWARTAAGVADVLRSVSRGAS